MIVTKLIFVGVMSFVFLCFYSFGGNDARGMAWMTWAALVIAFFFMTQ